MAAGVYSQMDKSDSGSSATTSTESSKPKEPKKEATTYKIGSTVTVKDVAYTITDVKIAKSVDDDNPFLKQKAKGTYVTVSMTIKNNDSEEALISGKDFKLSYDGATAETSSDTWLSDNNITIERLSPGSEFSGTITFDVPNNVAQSIAKHQLQIEAGWFSEPVTIQLHR